MEDRWLSMEEICKYLGVSNDTIHRWITFNSMPSTRFGRCWKFKKEKVDAWVEAGGAATKPLASQKKGQKIKNKMMVSTKKYSMSFTAAGLLRKETITVALLYLNVKSWEKTRQGVMKDNALQMKSENSRRRVFSEIKARLECLSSVEKQTLCSPSSRDADIILWLALCRRYQFIGNFAKTVLHEKYITMQRYVDFSDYALFVEREAVLHPEILDLRDSTSKRLRQMVFQFMRNCNMLNRENMIQPVLFSPAVETLFKNGNPEEINYFPVIPKMRAN